MKLKLVVVFFLACPMVANAQKKEISAAQTIIKSGKNLEKAEASMRKLLADSTHRNNLKVRKTLTDAVRGQYLAGNERLYLKQKQDTSALFDIALKMFADYEGLDSIDMMPDKKGRVRPRYREDNARFLHRYRPNLFNGGLYNLRNGQYEKAYHMMEAYIDCAQQPLFETMHYENDTLNSTAAHWALVCGYRMQKPDMALKYKQQALRDTTHLDASLRILADIYHEAGDSTNYCDALTLGFEHHPQSSYFFPRLIDYYTERGLPDSAMHIADEALAVNDTSALFLFAKSKLLLNRGDYDECIAICDTIITRHSDMPDVYYNAGVAYLNKAFLEEKKKRTSKQRKLVKSLYQKARPYMERCRALAPKNKTLWGTPLYNIYFKLNMGKEFEEIEQLMKEK